MRITDVRASGNRLSGQLQWSGGSRELYYEFEADFPLIESADAFLVAALIPAMRKKERVQVDAEISPLLAHSIPWIQQAMARWYPGTFYPVEVEVAGLKQQPSASPDGGTFFSLGVDSFYTALNAADCRYFVYMRAGVESLVENPADFDAVEQRIRAVASDLGKAVIAGSTNMREVLQMSGLDWGPYYHGAGLSAIGHALGLRRMYISSTHAINHLVYWASHPALDHLWSSERTSILHFGMVSRAEKTLHIIRHPVVLRNLRVCVENNGGQENCGCCWKCVRTMITLQALGLLEGAPFPYDGRDLQNELLVDDDGNLAFAEEIEDLLLRMDNPDRRLLRMIQGKLNKRRRMIAVSTLLSTMPRLRELIRRARSIHVPQPYRLPLTPVSPVQILGDQPQGHGNDGPAASAVTGSS